MKLKKFIASTLCILSLCSGIHVFAILPNGKDESWLRTISGKRWLSSRACWQWLASADGQRWLGTKAGWQWLDSEDGLKWLKSDEGKAWRRANHHCIIA